MEGRRSNRLVRWGFTILLVLTSVYIFYLYRDVKALLHEREERLEGMISVRTKMVEELNGAPALYYLMQFLLTVAYVRS